MTPRILSLIPLGFALLQVYATTLAEPPMPVGYKSKDEVASAIATGQVKLINPSPGLPEGVKELKGLEFAKVGQRSLQLDLYLPTQAPTPLPCLIFIHGGAWSGGSREIYKYYTCNYAKKGYAAATISYRLSGEAQFPAGVEDVKSAVRWLRAHAASYNLDPDRFAALGASAGGHLALMIGYSPRVKEFEKGANLNVSSGVQAVVNFYGPSDMTTDFAQKAGAVRRFLGKSYQEGPELYRRSSPMTYLDKDAPPTLILHGTIDETVPVEQSDALAARLKALGVPFHYEKFPGWPHTMDLAVEVNNRCQYLIDQFLKRHLGIRKSATQAPVGVRGDTR